MLRESNVLKWWQFFICFIQYIHDFSTTTAGIKRWKVLRVSYIPMSASNHGIFLLNLALTVTSAAPLKINEKVIV